MSILKLVSVLAVGVLAVVGAGVIYASHGGSHPAQPTNVTVTDIGDTEATINWDVMAVGEGECAVSDFTVRVVDSDDNGTEQDRLTSSPWTATGLVPSTDYTVRVVSYGNVYDCDEYSAGAYATFSTLVSDNKDGAEPSKKHNPKKVRNLTVSQNEVVRWSAPTTKNGKFHEATGYKVIAEHKVNGERVRVYDSCEDNACSDAEISAVTSPHTISGLVSGTRYSIRVIAYNDDCNCWGKWRTVKHIA